MYISKESFDIITSYLESHDYDIKMEENDFGELKPVYDELMWPQKISEVNP